MIIWIKNVKTGTIAPDVSGTMTVFPVWPYCYTCPSLKSGVFTQTKIMFLE